MSAEKKPLKLQLALPPSSIPDVISRRHAEREPVVGIGYDAMETGYGVFGTINELAAQVRDKPKLAAAVLPHVDRALAKFDKAIEAHDSRVAALDKHIADRVVGDGRDHVGGEIRQFLRESKTGVTKVLDAARRGERRTVAAALSAPSFLSGITDEQREVLLDAARKVLEPESEDVLADLRMNRARLHTARETFLQKTAAFLKSWRSDDDALLAKSLGGAA